MAENTEKYFVAKQNEKKMENSNEKKKTVTNYKKKKIKPFNVN